jgi:hypothetical protein
LSSAYRASTSYARLRSACRKARETSSMTAGKTSGSCVVRPPWCGRRLVQILHAYAVGAQAPTGSDRADRLRAQQRVVSRCPRPTGVQTSCARLHVSAQRRSLTSYEQCRFLPPCAHFCAVLQSSVAPSRVGGHAATCARA